MDETSECGPLGFLLSAYQSTQQQKSLQNLRWMKIDGALKMRIEMLDEDYRGNAVKSGEEFKGSSKLKAAESCIVRIEEAAKNVILMVMIDEAQSLRDLDTE
ncbi:unnamed protein product [Vicia faba]|uniref:Uncharacterized protein n=1 Tax=Vicia faba TaxID=3906 RepID=A0AAV1A2B6_VICFA|nr:unnamed protein product [Vicia faba]